MSVTTLHQSYKEYLYTWQALRDAYAGSGAVKAAIDHTAANRGVKNAGTKYLSRPAGMRRQEQYNAYRDRAIFFGATERCVHGLTGTVFRREPQIVAPARLQPQLLDITQTGVPLTSFAEHAIRETLLMGRAGILVEYPAPDILADGTVIPPPAISRPYWVLWGAEEIINWRTYAAQGDTVLSLVVLKECIEEPNGVFPSPDFFTCTTITQYRVLRLNEAGQYEVSLWRERAGSRPTPTATPDIDLVAQWVPERNGEPLPFIPFTFLAPFSLEPSVEKSLLEGLVEVNYQHYRHSADYEHGLHLTALPTPYITGYSTDNPALEIGSATAWAIPNADACVGMLEFQGQGLQSHERAMETDMKNMAALGARLLEGAPLVPETATAVLRRTEGAESPIQALVKNVSMGLSQALRWHGWWAGTTESSNDETILVSLNLDLLPSQMEPNLLRELVGAWLSGAISFETLFFNLKRGELIETGIDSEDEQARIEIQEAARGMAILRDTSLNRNGTRRVGETV